jgi:hypothetical protein
LHAEWIIIQAKREQDAAMQLREAAARALAEEEKKRIVSVCDTLRFPYGFTCLPLGLYAP